MSKLLESQAGHLKEKINSGKVKELSKNTNQSSNSKRIEIIIGSI